MKEKGGGAIVNLASINSFEGKVERGAFSYSKGGIVNLTRTMAAELGRYGIRVNAVAPGCVRTTEFMKHVEAGVVDLDTLTALTPLGMLQEPEDIAEAIIFLASEKARSISGVTLPVDGGWLSDGGKGMGRPSERT
jgi:NAD(P)-dependent dehydrogenase (short-subunit alcohol dehydrogenase family)